MDDVHLLTARHFRHELCRGGKIFSSKFGAREVCIAPQARSLLVRFDFRLSEFESSEREISKLSKVMTIQNF